jgi:hypothetical protein
MKKQYFMIAVLMAFTFVGIGQIEIPPDTAQAVIVEPINIGEIAKDVLEIISRDSAAIAQLPQGGFDATDRNSIWAWWTFIFALIMPFGTWVFNKFFPSVTKKELILKSTAIAVVVLMIIIGLKGMTIAVIGQAVLAFIMEVVAYDKILSPLGLSSPRADNYEKVSKPNN